MASLALIPALRSLDPAALESLTRNSRPVRLDSDTVIRRAGEPAGGVVLLLSGTVVASYTGPAGAQVWPARWEGPAIVDKPAVLHRGAPPIGLVARTRCVARMLPRARFLRLLDEEESVRRHVLDRLAQDVLDGRRRLVEAATLPAVAQVAAWLSVRDPDRPVAWRGSQEDLARILGLSRVTVNRALTRLSRAGALRITSGGIVVVDRRCLGTFAGTS